MRISRGEPTVSSTMMSVLSRSSSCSWRATNALMPSSKDSSEPVETSRTRMPETGSSASRRATASIAATALRLSLAPGTTDRAPMSANDAAERNDIVVPALRSRPSPRSEPSVTSTGPRKTRPIEPGHDRPFSTRFRVPPA
jgi:hypothetical protein